MTDLLETSFVAAVGDAYAITPERLAALSRALDDGLAEARAAWPGVDVAGATFAAFLADRVPDDGDPGKALASMRVPDLYLACACALGVEGAAAAFEASVMHAVPRAVSRVDADLQFVDEITARVRAKLLVGDGDRPPRVSSYLGRGPLTAFAQVVAMREAQSEKRRARPETPVDVAQLLEVPIDADDPELANLAQQVREPFGRALRAALADLSPRARTVLRLYLVEGVGSERIATMYDVHRATVARWVGDARADVLSGTRRRLMKELALGESTFASLMGQVGTKLDVNLATFLSDG